MPLMIEVPAEEIADLCRRHGIRRLLACGSVLRDDFGPDSDIDLIMEFEPEVQMGFFELFDMQEGLAELLRGRRVDPKTPKMLRKYFLDRGLARAEALYERA